MMRTWVCSDARMASLSLLLAWLNAATLCAQGGADNRKKKRSVFIDDIADVDDDDEDEEIDVSDEPPDLSFDFAWAPIRVHRVTGCRCCRRRRPRT